MVCTKFNAPGVKEASVLDLATLSNEVPPPKDSTAPDNSTNDQKGLAEPGGGPAAKSNGRDGHDDGNEEAGDTVPALPQPTAPVRGGHALPHLDPQAAWPGPTLQKWLVARRRGCPFKC